MGHLIQATFDRARREYNLGEWWESVTMSERFVEWRKLDPGSKAIVTDHMREVRRARGEEVDE